MSTAEYIDIQNVALQENLKIITLLLCYATSYPFFEILKNLKFSKGILAIHSFSSCFLDPP